MRGALQFGIFTCPLATVGEVVSGDKRFNPVTPSDPDYFQTEPGPFAGPTKTGALPFLAQTSFAPPDGLTHVPNNPLQTFLPIKESEDGRRRDNESTASIFSHMGNLGPYQPSQFGFGADELPIPPGANISQLHVLHRHGARYPTGNSGVREWGLKIEKHAHQFNGDLSFLNNWSCELGLEMLTMSGRQELFDSGIQHFFNYGRLCNSSAKYVVRTTTKYRMMESAEYFLMGFFGPNWSNQVKLEPIIEDEKFNNTLAGYKSCPNSVRAREPGFNATAQWNERYLANATARLRTFSDNYNWTLEDTVYAQAMCSLETVGLGFSPFCLVFTMDEWLGFEYSSAIQFMGHVGFLSPVGRATGIGYVSEFMARVEGHVLDDSAAQVNRTLDSDPVAFPVKQSLYFDFGHDTTLMSVLTAFGLKQFAQFLPPTGPPSDQQFISSETVPFAGRLAIEIITAPRPVREKRASISDVSPYDRSQPEKETKYVRFVLNQRTLPLGRSLEECGSRDDGWCELETFMAIQRKGIEYVDYDYSCFGDYPIPKYGDVTDGIPPRETPAPPSHHKPDQEVLKSPSLHLG